MNNLVRENDGRGPYRSINGYGQEIRDAYRGWEIRYHRQVSDQMINGVRVRNTTGVFIGHLSFRGMEFDTKTHLSKSEVKRAIDFFWKEGGAQHGLRESDIGKKALIA